MKRLPSFGLQGHILKQVKYAEPASSSQQDRENSFGLFAHQQQERGIISEEEYSRNDKNSIHTYSKDTTITERKVEAIENDINSNSNSIPFFREITASFIQDMEAKGMVSQTRNQAPVQPREFVTADDMSIKTEIYLDSKQPFDWIYNLPFGARERMDNTNKETLPLLFKYERQAKSSNFESLKSFGDEQNQLNKKNEFVELFMSLFEEYTADSSRVFYIFNKMTAFAFFHTKTESKKSKGKMSTSKSLKSLCTFEDSCLVLVSSERDMAAILEANSIEFSMTKEEPKTENPLEKENKEIEKELTNANIELRRDDEFTNSNIKRQLLLIKKKHVNMLVQYIINDFYSEESFQLIANFPYSNCSLTVPTISHHVYFSQEKNNQEIPKFNSQGEPTKNPILENLMAYSVFGGTSLAPTKCYRLKISGYFPAPIAKEIYDYVRARQHIFNFLVKSLPLTMALSKDILSTFSDKDV